MENRFAVEPSSPSSMNGNRVGTTAIDSGAHRRPPFPLMKVFTCKYCSRRFLNSRAFGGHQNAHKKERKIGMLISNQVTALDLNKPAPEDLSGRSHALNNGAAADHGDYDILSNWDHGSSYVQHPYYNDNDNDSYSYFEANKGPLDASNIDHHQQPDLTSNLDLDLHL